MLTDPISDMLTRIRNASMVRKQFVDVPRSKIKFAIAKILQKEQCVSGVEEVQVEGRDFLRLKLRYSDGASYISSLRRISKPGRRVYAKADRLPHVRSGFGFAIVSTPNGLMTNREARKRRLGGEVLCEIY
jgi:small subunit ribosomal protein S8